MTDAVTGSKTEPRIMPGTVHASRMGGQFMSTQRKGEACCVLGPSQM